MMGLDDYRDKFVSDLSTGSRRIVDLACQIGIEPKVILFDEPSSGIAQRETEALGPLLAAHPRHHRREHPAHRARHAARQLASPTASSPATSDGSSSTATAETVLNHPHVVASYLGSTREVIERSGPSQVRAPPKWSRGHVHDADRDRTAPQFKARRRAGSPTRTSAGSGASSASTRTRSASRGRRCSGRCCAREKQHAEVALHRHDHLHGVGLLQVTNLTRGMVDNAIVDQIAPLWAYLRYITFWAVWALVFSFGAAADRRPARRTRSSSTCGCGSTRTSSRPTCAALDQVATGQLVTRSLTDLQLVEHAAQDRSRRSSATRRSCSRSAIIVIILNPIMGVLAMLALPINVWLVNKFRSRLRALSWAELNERAEVTTRHRRARARDPRGQGVRPRGPGDASASPASPSAPSASR